MLQSGTTEFLHVNQCPGQTCIRSNFVLQQRVCVRIISKQLVYKLARFRLHWYGSIVRFRLVLKHRTLIIDISQWDGQFDQTLLCRQNELICTLKLDTNIFLGFLSYYGCLCAMTQLHFDLICTLGHKGCARFSWVLPSSLF